MSVTVNSPGPPLAMPTRHSSRLQTLLKVLAGVVILKVTASVVLVYPDYLPPNFQSDFLRGRDAYFFGAYQWAFYAHIATGPCTLVVGGVLLSDRFRRKYPAWHRRLGRVQVACVLLLVAPSGLWMARYAQSGAVAGAGFASLAVATGLCVWRGWSTAVRRQFGAHRRWMCRCYLLLCSAVVLRLFGGVATIAEIVADWPYQLAAWMSWLLPLATYEWLRRTGVGLPVSSSDTAIN